MTGDYRTNPDYMSCRICKYALNSYNELDGSVTYLHGRPELDFDHKPDPVHNNEIEGGPKQVCDFCRTIGVSLWDVKCPPLSNVRQPDGSIHNYSPDWTACNACVKFVKARDMDGLIERVHYIQGRRNGISPKLLNSSEVRLPNIAWLRELYGYLWPTITAIRPLTREPMSMDDIPPSKLPKVRDKLVRLWGDPSLAEGYVDQQSRGGLILPGVDAGDEDAFAVNVGVAVVGPHKFCRRMEVATQVADLYWISAGFTRLAMGAGRKLVDMTIARDELPSANGLLVWESPVASIDGVSGTEADVFGIGWTLVPGGMWLVTYVRAEEFFVGQYETLQGLREKTGWFFPANCGAGIGFNVPARASEDTQKQFSLIGTVFATWHLMRQDGIAEETREQPDKATRKAYGRARRPIPEVRVVNLRKRARAARGPSDAPPTRAAWSYRVMVGGATGGFWRTYWTGPGRAVKEQRWIEPYLTGDDSLPMKDDLDLQIVKTLK